MRKYVISIGSNVFDSAVRVSQAISYLSGVLACHRVSEVYQTPSINGDGTFYSNAVIAGNSDLELEEMQVMCKDYEQRCGRLKGHEVIIDLDVVIADDEILRPKDASRNYFTLGFKAIDQG